MKEVEYKYKTEDNCVSYLFIFLFVCLFVCVLLIYICVWQMFSIRAILGSKSEFGLVGLLFWNAE